MAIVVLCNVIYADDLDMDLYSVIAKKPNLGDAGAVYRSRLDKGKRLGYTLKSGIDQFGRVWATLRKGERMVKYYVCTEQIAKRTLLI